jgi:hypothetical protein
MIKVGDYVRYINNYKNLGLTKNKVYKVLKENDIYYKILNDSLEELRYLKHRFVKAYTLKDKLALIKELIK